MTCHYPCSGHKDGNLKKCSAIKFITGKCRVCPKKCSWKDHRNEQHRWEYVQTMKTVMPDDVKKEYEALNGKILTDEELVQNLEKHLKDVEDELGKSVSSVTKSINRLDQIARRPTKTSCSDYIDLLVANEQRANKTPGHYDKVEALMKLKKQINKQNELFDLHRAGQPLDRSFKSTRNSVSCLMFFS
jgi:hypothetical protein